MFLSNILQPEIEKAEQSGYTYQWYRYGEEEEHSYWEEVWDEDEGKWVKKYHIYYDYGSRQIIYGAVSDKLEINDCMTGDFTKYQCMIFYEGMKVMEYTVKLAESTDVDNIKVENDNVQV